jgi:hypothetical protein
MLGMALPLEGIKAEQAAASPLKRTQYLGDRCAY